MSKNFILIAITTFCCLLIVPTPANGIQCYTCRGINCLRTSIQNKLETCENSLDSCVTVFEKFTIVAKGCLMNIPFPLRKKCNDIGNPECQVCSGELCNTMGRSDFKCYQCDERDKDNKKCATNIEELTPTQCSAPTSPNSYCYTKSYKGYTVRGCSLSVKDQKECLGDSSCSLCLVDDGEGCNSKKMDVVHSGVSKISTAFALILFCVSMTRFALKF